MASCAQMSQVSFSLLMAEALEILHGLQLASESGLWPCIVESDSQLVVSTIDSGNVPLSDIGLIIEDILDPMKGPLRCKVCFISRKSNMVAHCLDKLGVALEVDCFWIEEVHLVRLRLC
ncbi:hypothetical protein Dsin_018596 [Dipteronia sinensis]|uniref:RNase H type-1 domain-containing protein n=1 Tax=Dipteronia sinensis TaxID=43782 RepID=A0AAE0E1Y3_9ROSI|nr:hypothetical protein Dsin_018596 [Dipteronia sinensis]